MLLATLLAMLVLAGPQSASTEEEGKTYGKDLAGAPEVKIAELVARPGAYTGKTVRVRGFVVAVGENGGTWMDVADNADGPTIRIRGDDEATAYPIEAKGNPVVAEGVFTKLKTTPDEIKGGNARPGDAASMTLEAKGTADSPKDAYLIRATGATIKM